MESNKTNQTGARISGVSQNLNVEAVKNSSSGIEHDRLQIRRKPVGEAAKLPAVRKKSIKTETQSGSYSSAWPTIIASPTTLIRDFNDGQETGVLQMSPVDQQYKSSPPSYEPPIDGSTTLQNEQDHDFNFTSDEERFFAHDLEPKTTNDFFSKSTDRDFCADDFFDYENLEVTQTDIQEDNKPLSTTPTQSTASTTSSRKSTWSERSGKVKSKVNTGLEETSHFLGGLIKKPVESRKHYTILRHSHGLVYYRGPETAVAITIFADRPLPVNRRLWFQMKGWSGHTGMATKALLRSNSTWINVTPDRQVQAKDLPPLDERAWQRDIHKFQKRVPKAIRKHTIRETAVVRIPAECTDGYFRIVLTDTDSRAMLCPSPVFRIASTSMSAASFKGASLRTLPLELAIKVAQVATTTVAATAAAPYTAAAQAKAVAMVPASQYIGHAQTAYEMIGVQDKLASAVDAAEARQMENAARIAREDGTMERLIERPAVVGNEDGPDPPYPLQLKGTISAGTGGGRENFGIPTANIDDIAPDRIAKFNYGIYFGYANVVPRKDKHDLAGQWEKAIIAVIRNDRNAGSVVQRKVLRVYLIQNYPLDTIFFGSTLDIMLLDWLRQPLATDNRDVVIQETIQDINIVEASLNREAWSSENSLHTLASQSGSQSLPDRLVRVKTAGQRQLDRIPMHKLGVRTDSFASHDRGLYGNGGVFVRRD